MGNNYGTDIICRDLFRKMIYLADPKTADFSP